jgi:hypothetical protein
MPTFLDPDTDACLIPHSPPQPDTATRGSPPEARTGINRFIRHQAAAGYHRVLMTERHDGVAEARRRYAPAVLANRLSRDERWGTPCRAYNVCILPTVAERAGFAEVQAEIGSGGRYDEVQPLTWTVLVSSDRSSVAASFGSSATAMIAEPVATRYL